MAVSVESVQRLEAALRAEVDNLKAELVQVRAELAQNLQAHAAGVPIAIANEIVQIRAELSQSAMTNAGLERRMSEPTAASKATYYALQNEFNITKAQAMPKERTSGERNSLADTKSVGKPPILAHGEMKHFPNWEFSVMLYLIATQHQSS